MREVQGKKNTAFEVDFVVDKDASPFGMSIWCGVHIEKKLELDFEHGIATFMTADDAHKFEEEYGQA